MDKWYVGKNDGGDGQPLNLETFDTFDEVTHYYDKTLMVEDPDGVMNGDYYIDGPEEENCNESVFG